MRPTVERRRSETDPSGPPVRPDRLLRRSRPLRYRPAAAAARAAIRQLLQRMARDELRIIDDDGTESAFGPSAGRRSAAAGSERTGDGADELTATVTVHDDRAWTAVATEGSIGLGRGFIEGWWTSDDPTAVVRVIIRNLGGLDDLRNRLDRATAGVADRVRRVLPRRGRAGNREDIASHYDLGNDFFALFLDETMTYSSGVFAGPGTALVDASLLKYDRLLAKLAVAPDHHVLEIGTGWGGFALRAAQTTGCRVTSTTISAEQHRGASARIEAAGLTDRVTLLTDDWRDLTGRYDRLVAIEMIEAVDWRDYERFFATIGRCLVPDGMVGLQAICVPDRRFERAKNTEDFIRRFVFPGGFLPSIGAISRAVGRATKMQIIDVEDLSAHYAETLRRWRTRFDSCEREVADLGLDERFRRLWRFYLSYCEAGFLERHCTVNQIILAGPEWRPSAVDLRPC